MEWQKQKDGSFTAVGRRKYTILRDREAKLYVPHVDGARIPRPVSVSEGYFTLRNAKEACERHSNAAQRAA